MAVAGAFPTAWSTMLGSPGWWPDARQAECARLQREAGSLADVVCSSGYAEALGRSLLKWRAFRGTRFDGERLRASLNALAPLLQRWEAVSILTLREPDLDALFELFDAVREVKPTQRKWVVTSKMLHHVLPDLIVPMDNLMTAPFLGRASLPAAFEPSFLAASYGAFVDLARGRARGIGAPRIRAAAREIPYPVAGAKLRDCRIGHARVVDFAIAGYVRDHGAAALRAL